MELKMNRRLGVQNDTSKWGLWQWNERQSAAHAGCWHTV